MSWAKLDDRYDDNRKIKRAWRRNRAAVGLHAMAITYCSRHRTDGVVDIDWLEERLPTEKERAKVVGVLVDGGLFEELDEEHWYVHDFLDYNPSRQARDEASDAARNAALVRWSKEQDAARNADADADGTADSSAEGMRDPMPHPSRPDPTEEQHPPTPQGGKVVTFDRRPVPKHRLEASERLLHAFNARAGTDYGAYTGDGKPSESLRRIIGALTRHPNVSAEQWEAAIRWRFEHAFWDGVPDTGVVFGPKVDSANLASSMQEPRRQADLTAKLVGS